MSLQTHPIQSQLLEDLGNLTELQSPQLVTSTPVQPEMFTLTLPHPLVPTLTPLSRSHEYLTTPTGKSPAAVRQYSHPSYFDWNQSKWLNMDGIPHEIPPTMFGEILPPPEHSPDFFFLRLKLRRLSNLKKVVKEQLALQQIIFRRSVFGFKLKILN